MSKPSHVTIEYCETTCADGVQRTYASVTLVAFARDAEGREWRCEHALLTGEHWEPAVQRAADAAAERYGVDVLDLREGE